MAFPQLGYQYMRPIEPSSERQGNRGCRAGPALSPSGPLASVLSSMYGAPYAAAAAAQGYGAFLPYAAELPIFPQLGSQYDVKDSPGVQHPAFSHPHPAFYPYGQYQFGDPSRPKNATRESTSTLKAWLNEHRKNPYPTKGEKIMLAIITKMTLTQVSTWFANARRRLKKENKMTWAPRSRTDEEGNAYGSEHDEEEEGDKRGDPDEEEIDLENVDTEHVEGTLATAVPGLQGGGVGGGGGGGGGQLLLEGEDEEEEEEEGLEGEEEEGDPEEDAALLPSDAKASDSDASDGCLEDFPDGRERLLLLREVRGPLERTSPSGPRPLQLLPHRFSPPASPPTAPSPALPPPPPPPPPPAKPKIWSLAETATSPDNPSQRKSPVGSSSGGVSPPSGATTASPSTPSSLQLVGAPSAAPSAPTHRLVSACPLGKFAAAWTGARPFSAHHHHHHHHPHPLTLLNTPHLLGLAGGNASTTPNAAAAAAAAAAALAAFSRPADQAQNAETAGGTDRSSALEIEKKLIKTAFQPVQRRPQNQLDAAMVLSALSSS